MTSPASRCRSASCVRKAAGVSSLPAPIRWCGRASTRTILQPKPTAPVRFAPFHSRASWRAVAAEVTPGPAVESETDLLAFARQNGATIFHPAGTCRMGADDAAVVDPQLRVRGVGGLWVADCSLMPKLVSGNTNLPAIMLGEKVAVLTLEDQRQH